eukprot:3253500-Pleurochrysis_carterae.AAC.5
MTQNSIAIVGNAGEAASARPSGHCEGGKPAYISTYFRIANNGRVKHSTQRRIAQHLIGVHGPQKRFATPRTPPAKP